MGDPAAILAAEVGHHRPAGGVRPLGCRYQEEAPGSSSPRRSPSCGPWHHRQVARSSLVGTGDDAGVRAPVSSNAGAWPERMVRFTSAVGVAASNEEASRARQQRADQGRGDQDVPEREIRIGTRIALEHAVGQRQPRRAGNERAAAAVPGRTRRIGPPRPVGFAHPSSKETGHTGVAEYLAITLDGQTGGDGGDAPSRISRRGAPPNCGAQLAIGALVPFTVRHTPPSQCFPLSREAPHWRRSWLSSGGGANGAAENGDSGACEIVAVSAPARHGHRQRKRGAADQGAGAGRERTVGRLDTQALNGGPAAPRSFDGRRNGRPR